MKVIVAKTAGFCWGVRRAVDRVMDLAKSKDANPPVYTDGPLIHNEQMLRKLEAGGVREVRDLADAGDHMLVIRAHGAPPERRRLLRSLPSRIIDATCPDVASIQGRIKKHVNAGYHIVIFGDDGHAEVVGLLGFADGKGHVVCSPQEVDALPEMDSVCLVSQSTQFPSEYRKVADAIIRRFPGAKALDTICKATKSRQAELLEIARQVDALVVVGGAHSANTLRLVKLARKLKPTFHIQVGSQLEGSDFAAFSFVGLTAGASTPDFVIQNVKRILEGLPGNARGGAGRDDDRKLESL